MPRSVAIIADAGQGAGLGHLSRSSAVAVALRCRGIEPRCFAYGAVEPFDRDGVIWSPLEEGKLPVPGKHALVIDSYRLPEEVFADAAQSGRLVLLHDYGDVPDGTALVVSVAAEPAGDGCRLTGPRYAALRPGFWGLPERRLGESVGRVLVTTGSGQFAELGSRLARELAEALPEVAVALVRGPDAVTDTLEGIQTLDAPESLLEPLLRADLVVTAAGQTMLEAAATGTPCVAVPLVDNQRNQARRLAELGAVRLVESPEGRAVVDAASELSSDLKGRRRFSRKAQEAVDGFGALRVAFAIDELARQAS